LLVWAQAIYLIVASSNGVSAVKIEEMLDLPSSTTRLLGHRVRATIDERNWVLCGIVEVNEILPNREAGCSRQPRLSSLYFRKSSITAKSSIPRRAGTKSRRIQALAAR
jgi:hypothetical protein